MGIVIRRPKELEARKMLEELKKRKIIIPKQKSNTIPQISLNPTKIYERIYKIWDLSSEELYPRIEHTPTTMTTIGLPRLGGYSPLDHKMLIPPVEEKLDVGGIFDHELAHSVDYLMAPEEYRPKGTKKEWKRLYWETILGLFSKRIQYDIKTETIAEQVRIKTINSQSSKAIILKQLLLPLFAFFPSFPIVLARTFDMTLLRKGISNIVQQHGSDGILLYIVYPPRVIGTLETYIWRKKMVKYGILNPDGGLTPKGIEFIKKILPKEEILRRLTIINNNRKKSK